jgi:hypothetical protein
MYELSENELTFFRISSLSQSRDNILYKEQIVEGHTLRDPNFALTFWVRYASSLGSSSTDMLIVNDESVSYSICVTMAHDPLNPNTLGHMTIELRKRGHLSDPAIFKDSLFSNKWHHIGILRNRDDWRVYISGNQEPLRIVSDHIPDLQTVCTNHPICSQLN